MADLHCCTILRWRHYELAPSFCILYLAALNSLEDSSQLLVAVTRFISVTVDLFQSLRLELNAFDWQQAGRSSSSKDFREGLKFFVMNFADLYGPAKVFPSDIHDASGGDRLNSSGRVRDDQRRKPAWCRWRSDGKEPGVAEFVNVRPGARVKMEGGVITSLACQLGVEKHGGVVASDFGIADAKRGCAVKVLDDKTVCGFSPAVDPNG